MIDIRKKLTPVWEQIVKAENRNAVGNVGTGVQEDLENAIRPLCPPEIDYYFHWDMSGFTQHIFYEKQNPINKFVI